MGVKVFISELRLYVCNHIVNKVPSVSLRMWFYRKIMKFNIGAGTYIFLGCTFDTTSGLAIGHNSVINSNCRIDTRGGISIGNNVSISNNTIIITADHDMNDNMKGRNKPVFIEDYVWIGTEAMLLPGAYIAKGSVVAARALVTKEFRDENSVIAGTPAKIIKTRENVAYNYSASYKRLFQ